MKIIHAGSFLSFLACCAGVDTEHWIRNLILAGIFLAVAWITGDRIIQDLEWDEEDLEGGEEE